MKNSFASNVLFISSYITNNKMLIILYLLLYSL